MIRASRAPSRLMALGLLLLAGGAPVALGGQQLDRVEELMSRGEMEAARGLLDAWMSGSPPRAQLPRGIWLQGRLASDPEVAALHYGRVAVEFPGSGVADEALLRLGMLAEARGDRVEAHQRLSTLLRDHPGSPLRLEAGERLRRLEGAGGATTAASGEAPPPPGGEGGSPPPPWELRAAIEEALRQDLELREMDQGEEAPLGFPMEVGVPTDTSAMETSLSEAPLLNGGLPEVVGRYTVQMGAFSSRERAEALVTEAARAGLRPRVVQIPGSPLFRVRVGSFQDPSEGDLLRREVIGLGFEAVTSSDGDREIREP